MSLSPELLQTTREKTAPPKRFGVFLLNDNNSLIWHLSDDLKRFKRITEGHTVIMGW